MDARTAIDDAREAQGAWAALPLDVRARRLLALRDRLLSAQDQVIAIAMEESGKVKFEAVSLELVPAVLNLTFVARKAPEVLADQRVKRFLPLPRRSTRVFDPHGVCALIAPWNYTLSIPMATLAPALAAGNAVVWKPGVPGARMARLVGSLLGAAGIDPRLVQILEGGAAEGQALIDAEPDHVTFIGSSAIGRKVAGRCGERLIPSIIELGGKAPAIVLADADLDRAARAIVFGRLSNDGASCVAVERVIAVDRVFDDLRTRVIALAHALDGRTSRCPVPQQVEKVARLRDQATRAGLTIESGVFDATGHTDLSAWTDEAFGPLLPFVRVANADEAIHVANDHPLQLSAYVFSRDSDEADRVARALKAPHVVTNDVMIHYAMMELPFGGRGASGFGRVHGIDGIRAYAVDRTLVAGHLPLAKEPWWLPYEERLLDGALKALPTAVRIWDKLK